jgi:hypothetical protein
MISWQELNRVRSYWTIDSLKLAQFLAIVAVSSKLHMLSSVRSRW